MLFEPAHDGKKRVLMLGFSVLTHHCYVSIRQLDNPEFEFDCYGFGGHHFNHLVPLLPKIIANKSPDYVILDLASTPCRDWVDERTFRLHVTFILAFLVDRKIKPAFVNFYRSDVDYENDVVTHAIREMAKELGVPLLDFTETVAAMPADQRLAVMPDGIHFSQSGAEWASTRVNCFAGEVLAKSDMAMRPVLQNAGDFLRNLEAVDPEKLCDCAADSEIFRGYGVEMRALRFAENSSIDISAPDECVIVGAYFVAGPMAGLIRAEGPQQTVEIQNADVFSYYERMRFTPLPDGKRVRLTQMPGVPDVALAKGTFSDGQRLGKLGLVVIRHSGRR